MSYIGLTRVGVDDRWQCSINSATRSSFKFAALEGRVRTGAGGRYAIKKLAKVQRSLSYAIWKHGAGDDVWTHRLLEEHDSVFLACLAERRLIKHYRTHAPTGYNLTAGGELPPRIDIEALVHELLDSTIRASINEALNHQLVSNTSSCECIDFSLFAAKPKLTMIDEEPPICMGA